MHGPFLNVQKICIIETTPIELYVSISMWIQESPYKCSDQFENAQSINSGVPKVMGPMKVLSYAIVLLVAGTQATPLQSTINTIIEDKVSDQLQRFEQKLDQMLWWTKENRQCDVAEVEVEAETTTPQEAGTTTTTPHPVEQPPPVIQPQFREYPRVAPKSCAEALSYAEAPVSGIQHLYFPDSGLKQFPVYCLVDPDNGTAWTVIQRRVDAKTDFFVDFYMYKQGFGDLHRNFFIGLEKLYALTTQGQPQELWVFLRDPANVNASARYNAFAIDDEETKYRLNVLGDFEGDAGDSLRYSVGQQFAAKDTDRNNDCAGSRKSGWWFDYCTESNLNGQYDSKIEKAGLTWFGFRDHTVSMKYVHMAIRPRQ